MKAVKQSYSPSPELLNLLEKFRRMVNDCIRVGLAENASSMKTLSKKAYHVLAAYDVPTYYRLTAISKATGILRNYRQAVRRQSRARKPYATKLGLTDCYAFRVINDQLRLPIKARKEYVSIPLNAYVLRCIRGYTMRSVCLTSSTVSVTFSKEVVQLQVAGLMGLDSNLDNVTVADSEGSVRKHDLSRATKIRENCRQTKQGFNRNDCRIMQQLYSKYGRIQRNKVGWILHNVSTDIVRRAKQKRFGIVMENLTGMRKLYRRGNFQGKDYRAKLNSWSYAELQRQIDYKARWEGVPVCYVHPSGTSSTCAICGCKVVECAARKVYCPHCNTVMDRDGNAALNIFSAGLRFSPVGVAGEAVKANPEERKEQAIPGADAIKSTHHPKS
jgi:putative transposase